MATSKYSTEERQIVRKLKYYKAQQKLLQKKYYLLEMKINLCQSKINWKFGNQGHRKQ